MNVKELIRELSKCNPEAVLFVSKSRQISDYTWGDEHYKVTGILPWNEPSVTAASIEIVADGRPLDEE